MERSVKIRRTNPLSLTADEFPFELVILDHHRTQVVGLTKKELDSIRQQAFEFIKI